MRKQDLIPIKRRTMKKSDYYTAYIYGFKKVYGHVFEMDGFKFGIAKTGEGGTWIGTDVATGIAVDKSYQHRKDALAAFKKNKDAIIARLEELINNNGNDSESYRKLMIKLEKFKENQ